MAALAAGLALAAGCAPAADDSRTGPTPPDRLAVTLGGGGFGGFRVDLECVVSDRPACAEVLEALGGLDEEEVCAPAAGDGGRADVTGTIDGQEVLAVVPRGTDCERRAYDRIVAALGLSAPSAQPTTTSAAPRSPGATASAASRATAS